MDKWIKVEDELPKIMIDNKLSDPLFVTEGTIIWMGALHITGQWVILEPPVIEKGELAYSMFLSQVVPTHWMPQPGLPNNDK